MVFTGSFMHKNDVAQKKLATSIRYVPGNTCLAMACMCGAP